MYIHMVSLKGKGCVHTHGLMLMYICTLKLDLLTFPLQTPPPMTSRPSRIVSQPTGAQSATMR